MIYDLRNAIIIELNSIAQFHFLKSLPFLSSLLIIQDSGEGGGVIPPPPHALQVVMNLCEVVAGKKNV